MVYALRAYSFFYFLPDTVSVAKSKPCRLTGLKIEEVSHAKEYC